MEEGRSIDRGVSGEPDTKAFTVTQEITLRFETQDDYRTREAYKTLRTNIELCGSDIRTIAITSCTPNEGKTSVAVELARAFAEAGKQVVLVDADLRKSVLVGRYKTGAVHHGLIHVLAGRETLETVVHMTNIQNLYMIFAGPVPPNPSELLGGEKFKETLLGLRRQFDYIIVDTPPLGSVIDAAVVAKECDGAMLVIQNNGISRRFARKVKEQLEKTGCRVLGAILNKVDMSAGSIYGHYGRYYGKYYGKYYGQYYGRYGEENAYRQQAVTVEKTPDAVESVKTEDVLSESPEPERVSTGLENQRLRRLEACGQSIKKESDELFRKGKNSFRKKRPDIQFLDEKYLWPELAQTTRSRKKKSGNTKSPDAAKTTGKRKNFRHKERKTRKKKRGVSAALLCAGILAAVPITACACILGAGTVGKVRLRQSADGSPRLSASVAAQQPTEAEKKVWQDGWVKYKNQIYAYNEDILTFLFMGIDKQEETVQEMPEGTDGGQADALFLLVLNPRSKEVDLIGINRNTMTQIDMYSDTGAYIDTITAQICVQHGFGNGMEESCVYQKEAVSRLFYGLPIHGYAAVNFSAAATLNDAVGGVDVTVLEDMTTESPRLKEGAQVHLEGEDALTYVRWRDTDTFASADRRLERQMQYLEGFVEKAKSSAQEDIFNIARLYQAASPAMITDVTADKAVYLASQTLDYRDGPNNFYMLEGETVMGEQFEEYYIDETALYEMILEIFYEPVSERN